MLKIYKFSCCQKYIVFAGRGSPHKRKMIVFVVLGKDAHVMSYVKSTRLGFQIKNLLCVNDVH